MTQNTLAIGTEYTYYTPTKLVPSIYCLTEVEATT